MMVAVNIGLVTIIETVSSRLVIQSIASVPGIRVVLRFRLRIFCVRTLFGTGVAGGRADESVVAES